MRRRNTFASLLLCLPLLALAGPYEVAVATTFPDLVAQFRLESRRELQPASAGVALTYRQSRFTWAGVYIYNAGLSSIPNDLDAPVVRDHFAQIMTEVKRLEALGQVRSVRVPSGAYQVTQFNGCGPQFLRRSFEMDFGERLIASHTYLTVVRDHFVKLRISHPVGDVAAERDAELFASSVSRVLGRCS